MYEVTTRFCKFPHPIFSKYWSLSDNHAIFLTCVSIVRIDLALLKIKVKRQHQSKKVKILRNKHY